MRINHAFAALALLLLIPCAAPALDVSGQSRTYLQFGETVSSQELIPFYEYFSFKAEDLGAPNISFHFGGWLRYNLEGETYGKDKNSDLQYAYLSIRRSTANSLMNLGRLTVNEGVLSEQIDGAYARTDLVAGFGIAAFGGIAVETEEDGNSGDSVYGGRISQGQAGLYRIGFAYLKEKNADRDYREEEGVDLWFRPAAVVQLAGSSSYNKITSGWMQHNYNLSFGPFSNIRLVTDFSRVNYEDYFRPTTTSAFRTTGINPTLNPNEKMTSVGGALVYASSAIAVTADYKNYDYKIAGSADYYGGSLAYSAAGKAGAGLFLHRMDGSTGALQYDEYRAYVTKKFAKADATVDFLWVAYDQAINGVKNAYTAVVAAGYNFSKQARLAGDIAYDKNPYYNDEISGMIKFLYGFGK